MTRSGKANLNQSEQRNRTTLSSIISNKFAEKMYSANLRLVPWTGSLTGISTVSSLFASTTELSPLSAVPTSSATNSANSWNPVNFAIYAMVSPKFGTLPTAWSSRISPKSEKAGDTSSKPGRNKGAFWVWFFGSEMKRSTTSPYREISERVKPSESCFGAKDGIAPLATLFSNASVASWTCEIFHI